MTKQYLVALGVIASLVGVAMVLAGADPGAVAPLALAAVVQSTYNERIPIAVNGMVADMTTYDGDTLLCETADGIGFGVAVAQGTAANQGTLGGALALFRGVSVRDTTLVNATADEYQLGQNMGVMFRGDIWVLPSVAVLVTDPVHYDATTGRFAVSGGSGPIVGARWMTASAADALCKLRLSGHVPVP